MTFDEIIFSKIVFGGFLNQPAHEKLIFQRLKGQGKQNSRGYNSPFEKGSQVLQIFFYEDCMYIFKLISKFFAMILNKKNSCLV